ncbi:pyruvate formate-lyase-activating protein [Proteocatella sphenisci]|uniref:pyruvate formate-lyase-activating protein n=1 Tax=Proteocatella sphenisci TaxID=181070 RepID=UPI00048C1209|nr:pyruvate formate-lyase-activating protein [Proteocatella sphenisci]
MKNNSGNGDTKGRVSSFQSLGAVDGPGIRFVVFLQGCPLRCVYCHNPETWSIQGGIEMTANELYSKIKKYKNYFGKNGGVTVSGGEALLQVEFVKEIFRICKENNIHTALDTSGMGCEDEESLRQLFSLTDLVICDVKFASEENYKNLTGGSLEKVLHFLELTKVCKIPVWLRQVIVPGINDDHLSIKKLNDIADRYENVEKVELLGFRKLCISKYDSMNMEFKLKDTPETSEDTILKLYKHINKR